MSRSPGAGFQPATLVTLLGLAALAAITVVDRGATRMFLDPWSLARWTAVLAPWMALALRAISRTDLLRLPAGKWVGLLGAGALIGLASAALSPWPHQSLLGASEPLAFFPWALVVFDWIDHDRPARLAALVRIGAWTGVIFSVISLVLWIQDARALPRDGAFWRAVADMRNPHPLGHSNYTAGLCLLLFPWPWVSLWRSRGLPGLAWAAVGGAILLVLVTSGSRAGLGGLAAETVILILLSKPTLGQLVLGCAAAACAVALLAVANPRIRSLLIEPDPQVAPNESHLQRSAMTKAGTAMGAARPILGWGPGTTPLAFPRFRGGLDGGVENALELHSAPVQLWAETGGLGLAAAVLLVALAACSVGTFPAAGVALGGYLVFALADWQGDIPAFGFLAAALLATLIAPAPADRPRWRTLTALACLAALVAVCLGQAEDPTPRLNARALALAAKPEGAAEAGRLLRDSLKVNPDQEIAYFNLGWLNVVANPAEAEADFVAAARLVPDKGGVYFGAALAAGNQGKPAAVVVRALALESLNDPAFITSPWWQVPQLKALRPQVLAQLDASLGQIIPTLAPERWPAAEAAYVRELFRWFAGRAGSDSVEAVACTAQQRAFFRHPDLAPELQTGPVVAYHRERIGYPVVMRNPSIGTPVDVYLVQDDPVWHAHDYLFPTKGWLQAHIPTTLTDDPSCLK